ncbi:MAG: permease-like cell division protein FtsX [Parcubacteria group bacterium]|jgi:cell division transport system permease protein
MKILKLWRTLKEGFQNFIRNGWLSVATISILTISLYLISLTFMIGITANLLLENVKGKINISIYFNPAMKENDIVAIKNKLQSYKEVKSVEYVSKDQALREFMEMGNNDPAIKQALDEIGENPLLASLVIKANQSEQYDIINKSIESSDFREDISRINYDKNKIIIERLNKIVNFSKEIGMILGLIFVLIAILITFNAIRITIYSHKQEFEIERLVGASNLYIRMPFIFEGIFYGFSASIVSAVMLLVTAKLISSFVQRTISEDNLMALYLSNFWQIFGILFSLGILLGVISSFIAIRRYLKK